MVYLDHMKNFRGSNQHKTKYRIVSQEVKTSIWIVIALVFVGVYLGEKLHPPIISPLADNVYAYNEPTSTPTRKPEPTVENITAYISRKWAKHGNAEVKRALDISFCESGWRDKAYNHNSNGTGDWNIFQINSVHIKRYGTVWMHDWTANIDTAYKIYQAQDWKPWVCSKKV